MRTNHVGWSSVLVGLVVAAACARSPTPAAVQPVIHPAPPKPNPFQEPDTNLSGTWSVGGGDQPEPQALTVVLHPTCVVVPPAWLLEHQDSSIRAWSFPERYNQGIKAANDATARVKPAEGWVSGPDVVIQDESYVYVLRYDRTSTHLRGTRNGAPFWAVRQQVVRTGACPPPP